LLGRATRRSGRHQTLQAALDWSHGLLDERERIVLRRLAVFPGSFDLDAATAVAADARETFDIMRSLVRKSLVVTDDAGDARRFRLLETVRAYGGERLAEAADVEATRDRHRDHFITWAEAFPDELTYLDPGGAMRREEHNLRAALTWAEAGGRADLVGRLASCMNRIWLADIREGRRWLSLGLGALDDLADEHRVRLLAVAAHTAVVAIEAADGELAARAVEASGDAHGMWPSLAHALLCLNAGLRYFTSKDSKFADEAERLGRVAVERATEPLSRGLAWFWLGQTRVLLDDLDRASDALAKGSIEAIRGGDMSPGSLAMLAGVQHLRGLHDDALVSAEKVFERTAHFQDTGLWAWSLYCSLPYALELARHDRHDEARAFLRDLLEDSGAPLTPGVMTSAIVVLAAIAYLRGDVDRAALLLDYAGRAIVSGGIRTPVDIALYSHYWQLVTEAAGPDAITGQRPQTADMTLADAVTLGLADQD
jgi:hypothetical protein